MIVRTVEPQDLPRCRDLLADSLEIGFDLRPVAEEKLVGPGYGGPARSRVVLEDDAIRGIAVTCGSAVRLLVVEPAYRGRGLGTALLDDAASAIALSFPRVVIGAAPGNYLVPGVPATQLDTIEFFRRKGFATAAEAVDMVVNLDAPRPSHAPSEISVRRETTFSPQLESFLSREFGPAIAWEIGHGVLSDRAVVRVALSENRIIGFTACEINNAGIGSFGPQGVAAEARGHGVGRLLLHHSLADLREKGYSTARIPWVSSTDYYASSCGAEIAGEFVIMRRES